MHTPHSKSPGLAAGVTEAMIVHAALPDLDAAHFARWLALFMETAEEVCPPEAAALFVDRSQRIAESLKLGIDVQRGRGIPLAPAL